MKRSVRKFKLVFFLVVFSSEVCSNSDVQLRPLFCHTLFFAFVFLSDTHKLSQSVSHMPNTKMSYCCLQLTGLQFCSLVTVTTVPTVPTKPFPVRQSST
jgi:hypothetical protein